LIRALTGAEPRDNAGFDLSLCVPMSVTPENQPDDHLPAAPVAAAPTPEGVNAASEALAPLPISRGVRLLISAIAHKRP